MADGNNASVGNANAELAELLNALVNECIDETQSERLDAMLLSDADARQYYYKYVDCHLALGAFASRRLGQDLASLESKGAELSGDESAAPMDSTTPLVSPASPASNCVKLGSFALTISVTACVTLLVYRMFVPPADRTVSPSDRRGAALAKENGSNSNASSLNYQATLLCSYECQWGGDSRPRFDGQRLVSRRLILESGLAEFGFDSGVRIVLQGPAELTIESQDSATLQRGKVVLHGDQTDNEFALKTPNSVLFDVGTVYGASVNDAGVTELHVFSGMVRVESPGAGNSSDPLQMVNSGQARRIQGTRSESIAVSQEQFVRRLPKSLFPS
ncbi:MAG: hypothetical protein AAFP90_14205, partial [Planctomycetota bacterium]